MVAELVAAGFTLAAEASYRAMVTASYSAATTAVAKRSMENCLASIVEGLRTEEGVETEHPERDLERLCNSPVGMAVLHNAARGAFLSASREIGPRVIGYLTAELLARGTYASEMEETFFLIAEQLHDSDLVQFAEWYVGIRDQPSEKVSKLHDSFQVEIHKNTGSLTSNTLMDHGSASLGAQMGRWAGRIEALGVLSRSVTELNTGLDALAAYDAPTSSAHRQVMTYVTINVEFERLAKLILRSARHPMVQK